MKRRQVRMQPTWEERADGIVLPVKAHAGAKRNEITGVHDGQLKVSVTQAPERGKANQALIKVLCLRLGLRKSQVSLISGETSPQKQFLIQASSLSELKATLTILLDSDQDGR